MKKINKEQIVKSIERANPWWRGGGVGRFRELPKRTHFHRLSALIAQKEPHRALLIMGPRRIGKTVLLYQLIDALLHQKKKSPKKILYLSLDNPIFRLSHLEELLVWGMEWAETTLAEAIIFFDEIQYIETWEQQLKVLVDTYPHTKFVVTGSAAAALHKKSRESGAGRFTNYLLPPPSFYEYILIKGEIEDIPPDSIDLPKLNDLYLEYLNHGGFPESITSEAMRDQPEQYIGQDILDKVLGRDLPGVFGIANPTQLQKLFAALAYNTSNEVSPETISREAGIPKVELAKYLEFFEAAFLVRTIEKTDYSLKQFQRRTHFKVVLTNPSLRSAIFGKLSETDRDLEALAETAVFSQLIVHERSFPVYRYARWNHGNNRGEVDLVTVSPKGNKARAALEIKWSDRFACGEEKPKALLYFCGESGLKHAYMTTRSRFAETQHGDLKIFHIPTAYLCFAMGSFGGTLNTLTDYLGQTVEILTERERKNISPDLTPEDERSWVGEHRVSIASHGRALKYLKRELMSHMRVAREAVKELGIERLGSPDAFGGEKD